VIFTDREKSILQTVLSYAYSNVDDLNEACNSNILEDEIAALLEKATNLD
jgi:hypothetical protein